MTLRATLLVGCLLLAASAGAATVYRCGPDGRSYSDTPCAEGRSIAVDDARSTDQVAEARRVAALDRHLADRWTAERQRREAADAARHAAPGALTLRPPTPSASKSTTAPQRPPRPQRASRPTKQSDRPAADGTFRAAAPSSRRAPG